MLDDLYEIEESKLPALDDPKMKTYAAELGREYKAFRQPRISLEQEIWPACDRAFMAIRDNLPFIPTMKMIDNGMLGESDIRDALKKARNQIIEGICPGDESWLEPASDDPDNDNEDALRKAKNLLITKFEEAGVRDKMAIFVDQLLARGVSAVGLRYTTRRSVHKVPREMAKQMKIISQSSGLTDQDGTPLHEKTGTIRYWKNISARPELYPIDMYRLWLDPIQDLDIDSEPAYIYMMFKTKSDLKSAIDPDTGKPLYDEELVENITEWTYKDYYAENPHASDTTKLMGVDPTLEEVGKFIPIYLFYRQIRVFEDGEKFIDKIFYCARGGNASQSEWQIIRVQDNPSIFGDKPFFVANCDSWMGVPYGTGLAEKSLSALKSKNIIAALCLNAMVLQVFPPYFHVGGVLKDDRKPKFIPAGFQEIILKPGVGMEWIAPYPINPNNVQIGMQEQRHYSEKILSQTGAQTASSVTDPSKSLAESRTATEIKEASTDSKSGQQVIVDKLNNQIMEPMAQSMYNLLRQHETDETTGFINTDETGKPKMNTISRDELNKDRTIKIPGRRALANKSQLIDNLTEVLKILATEQARSVIQNLPLITQDALFTLLSQLGVPMKPEYKAKPEEIFAKEPQVQMAALQGLLGTPQGRATIVQKLIAFPDMQQQLLQLAEQVLQQHEVAKQLGLPAPAITPEAAMGPQTPQPQLKDVQ